MRHSLQVLTLIFHSGGTRVLRQQVAIKGNLCLCDFKIVLLEVHTSQACKLDIECSSTSDTFPIIPSTTPPIISPMLSINYAVTDHFKTL